MSGITSGFEGKAKKLRVKDAFKEDSGRGIVRIDPNVIQELDLKIITPLEVECRSGIITVEHEKSKKIHRFLSKNNMYVTLKRYPDAPKETLIRFAFNYYNNEADILRAVDLLKQAFKKL